jgi:hypothetical protein
VKKLSKHTYVALASILISFSFSLSGCGGDSGSTLANSNNANLGISGPPAAAPGSTVTTFPGPRNNYTITRTATGYAVTDIVGSGGTVNLVDQISAKFSDVIVNLIVGEKSKTISADKLKNLLELYVAFFNRVPDADGMAYWIGEIKNGMTRDQLAGNFYNAAIQYTALTGYSATMSDSDFVKIIYENVLGRSGATAPPTADVNYWANELSSGKSTKGALIATMLDSAHTYAGDATWGWVPQLLDNKLRIGQFFAIEQGLNYITPEESITKTMAIVKKITSSDASAAKDSINIKDQQFNQTVAYAAATAPFVVRTNPVGATTKAPTHVVWTGNKFIALEQSTDFHNAAAKFFTWISADGSSWTRNTTNMLSDYPNMSTANGLAFQLPGSTAGSPFTINSSSDGITWVSSTATYTGFAVPRTVKYLNGKYFISLDVDTCTVISSANASTWTSTDLRTLALPTGYNKRINTTYCSEPIFLGGKYLVYGGAIEFFVKGATSYLTQGLVYSSTDGVNWTASGFALPKDVNAIPQDGRSRTVLQIGDTVVIPSVRTETNVRLKPTDPYPTQVITNEQVGTSTDGLTFTYTKSTGIVANANTLAYYPSLQLPGGMLATTSTSTLVNFVSVFTYSYYFTTNGSTYTSAPDFKVGEGGYNVAPYAYSPTLKRLVFIKQETKSFAPTGVTINTYDFP